MNLKGKKIAFIGAGNMAEALVAGVMRAGICASEQIRVADVRAERRDLFRKQFGVQALEDNREAARGADAVVLAIKPQVMDEVLDELKGAVTGEPLFISIAAGITAGRIEAGLGGKARVVRVMPNMPALVGCGASALCAGAQTTGEDLLLAERLLGAVGVVIRVDEKHMDAVTALSGSGPAYVFYLMETMQVAAVRMGLEEETAARLTAATVEGAAHAVRESAGSPADLRRRVTSPGGTTEAALKTLEERKFAEGLMEAMEAARRRSEELSRG